MNFVKNIVCLIKKHIKCLICLKNYTCLLRNQKRERKRREKENIGVEREREKIRRIGENIIRNAERDGTRSEIINIIQEDMIREIRRINHKHIIRNDMSFSKRTKKKKKSIVILGPRDFEQ